MFKSCLNVDFWRLLSEKAIQLVELVHLNELTDSLNESDLPVYTCLHTGSRVMQTKAHLRLSLAVWLVAHLSAPTLALEHPGLCRSRHDRWAAEQAAETATYTLTVNQNKRRRLTITLNYSPTAIFNVSETRQIRLTMVYSQAMDTVL